MTEQPNLGKLNSILDWLLPQNDVRKITLRMLIPVVLAYVARILVNQWLESDRTGFNIGIAWLIVCPILCLVGAGLIAFILGLAFISARRAHHFAPALILVGGIALVPFLPLFPLSIPIFPEQDFFSTYKAEFQQVVMLARQDKLNCLQNTGCDVMARDLPPEYDHLSTLGFVQVAHDVHNELRVKFWPIYSSYPVIYFDLPDDKNSSWYFECHGGDWVRKLEEHWYLCVEDD